MAYTCHTPQGGIHLIRDQEDHSLKTTWV
jgi:hypothetical protein